MKTLINVNELKERFYTKKENAANHCQVGNINLVIWDIVNWPEE